MTPLIAATILKQSTNTSIADTNLWLVIDSYKKQLIN